MATKIIGTSRGTETGKKQVQRTLICALKSGKVHLDIPKPDPKEPRFGDILVSIDELMEALRKEGVLAAWSAVKK
ncbi:MAG TPA: hypothetical protein VND64_06460 [Pirellulales bacterium]|nr:hypothetical protein [Pirellulales bacterium]